MNYELLGWPSDGPRLDLDHERFAYAGNFRTGRKGIAVAREEIDGAGDGENGGSEDDASANGASGAVLAAASFDADRAGDDALRIRYVTVREDRRGEGIGPRLLAFLVARVLDRDDHTAAHDEHDREFERIRIGVNNPIAYQACYAAGFRFTGEESGMNELVLEAPGSGDRSVEQYRDGLERFADRDLPPGQKAVLQRHRDGDLPAIVEPGT